MTKIQIINLALEHIGRKSIAALDETSVEAQTAVGKWDLCLEDTLRAYAWSFATVVEALTLSAQYTPDNWLYAYQYPANCVAMRLIYNEGTLNKKIGEPFRELLDPANNKKVLVTNCDDALGEYTYLITDTTLYDASFINVLSYRLAADMAFPLTGDRDLAKDMMAIFNTQVGEAKRLSSYENDASSKRESTSDFIEAR